MAKSSSKQAAGNGAAESVRLDKWLWAARFYKTRNQATTAISGGKVHVDGDRTKPSRAIKIGQTLRIRKGTLEWNIIVDGLSDKRGSAEIAQQLYTESEESIEARKAGAEQRRLAHQANPIPLQKPTKKQRREIEKFLRRNRDL